MTFSPSSATAAVRASLETDDQHGAVVPPLHLSSNYTFRSLGDKREYDYTRSGNPTRSALADALAELEGGAGAVVTSYYWHFVDVVWIALFLMIYVLK